MAAVLRNRLVDSERRMHWDDSDPSDSEGPSEDDYSDLDDDETDEAIYGARIHWATDDEIDESYETYDMHMDEDDEIEEDDGQ